MVSEQYKVDQIIHYILINVIVIRKLGDKNTR